MHLLVTEAATYDEVVIYYGVLRKGVRARIRDLVGANICLLSDIILFNFLQFWDRLHKKILPCLHISKKSCNFVRFFHKKRKTTIVTPARLWNEAILHQKRNA